MITKNKVAATVLSLVIFATSAAPALASINVHVSGNGSGSDNTVRVSHRHSMSVSQSNSANINNSVHVSSNTGGNDANYNTDGESTIHTGNANTRVGIFNFANFNFARINHPDGGNNDNGTGGNGGSNDNGNSNHDAKKFHIFMNGSQEVPGPGDPNGWGHAKVKIMPDDGKLCIKMHVRNIEPATAAHVHQAPMGQAGPVVVPLPTPDSNGKADGCVDLDMNKLNEIKDNPSNFYINVHNSPYPDGAVRGQLSM